MVRRSAGHNEDLVDVPDLLIGHIQIPQHHLTTLDAGGSGHGALAGFLSALKVDALICGGIGGGAQMALSDAGVRLYGGVSGSADAAAEALAAGELDFNPNVRCDHHD